eukprot:COSAG01_NODE_35425_length_531_cov_292.888889_1_plen_138_part_01
MTPILSADVVSQDPVVRARRAAAVAQLSKFYKHGQQRQLVTAVVAFVASEAGGKKGVSRLPGGSSKSISIGCPTPGCPFHVTLHRNRASNNDWKVSWPVSSFQHKESFPSCQSMPQLKHLQKTAAMLATVKQAGPTAI